MGSGKIHETSHQIDDKQQTNDENDDNSSRSNIPVLQEQLDTEKLGEYQGQCKWFNDRYGYGFTTVIDGDKKGVDIFVHHSGVKTKNSHYKTLKKGEYIQFDIIESEIKGPNAQQAINVTGILGGPLMCDCISTGKAVNGYEQSDQSNYFTRRPPQNIHGPTQFSGARASPGSPYKRQEKEEWQHVSTKKPVGPNQIRPSYKNAVASSSTK